MQKRWTGKNVDMDLLSDCIESFFKDRGFTTKRTQSAGERTFLLTPQYATKDVKEAMTAKTLGTIFWTPQFATNLKRPLHARIVGDCNDFVIELIASELTRRSTWLGMLTKSFGGGYLVLRSLRLQEALEKLENEFWVYIEDKVAHLAGSAKHP